MLSNPKTHLALPARRPGHAHGQLPLLRLRQRLGMTAQRDRVDQDQRFSSMIIL